MQQQQPDDSHNTLNRTTQPFATTFRRRVVLTSFFTASTSLVIFPCTTLASTSTTFTTSTVFPPIEYLEPLYELLLSLNGIVGSSRNVKQYPRLKRRLGQFFGQLQRQYTSNDGVTEATYYQRIAREYVDGIQYSTKLSRDAIEKDKQTREQAIQNALDALVVLKCSIDSGDPNVVEQNARNAQQALTRWFALVPTNDVAKVEALIQDVRAADKDRDGKLSIIEMQDLSKFTRSIWEKRTRLFGASKVERCLGFKLTETSSY